MQIAWRPGSDRSRAEQPGLSFAGLLRQLRAEARLTQEELAEAAGVSPRSVSDLERGINRTAHKDTALLLADGLRLDGRRGSTAAPIIAAVCEPLCGSTPIITAAIEPFLLLVSGEDRGGPS